MKSNRRGFTFIELMIVVAIIGILFIVMSPNLSTTKGSFELYTLGRDCVVDFRYAQQLSIDTKEEHGVYFTTNGYAIKKNGTEIIKDKSFDRGIRFVRIDGIPSGQIVFKTNGSPYEYGKIDMVDSDSDIHIYVNVTRGTGEVSLSWE